MTRIELRRVARQYREQATEFSRWVCLNPANSEIWRAKAAKFRALAAAAEVDLAISEHRAVTRNSAAYRFAAVSNQNERTFFATEDEAFAFANKHNGCAAEA